MKMGKILFYIFFVAIIFCTAWHLHFFLSIDYGRSSLKNSVNYELSKSSIFSEDYDGHKFKQCFKISTIEKSLNCDFIKDKTLRNKSISCVKNGNVIKDIKGFEINKSNHVENQCHRFITLESQKGRTGNQMFEVASLLGIAFTHDLIPVIPLDTVLKRYFDLPDILLHKKTNKLFNLVNLNCSDTYRVCNFSKRINTEKINVSLSGYMQSWKYFYDISNIIKRVFQFKETHLEHAKQYLSSVSKNDYNRVCIHIRRGDLISRNRLSQGYAIPEISFFEKARQFYLKKFGLVQFIVISKEKEWCRKHILNASLSNFTSPGDDLALLSLCDHVVVTLGTFGWWGAWLSGGTTVYFDGYPRKGSWLESKMKKADYYPPSWIGIS